MPALTPESLRETPHHPPPPPKRTVTQDLGLCAVLSVLSGLIVGTLAAIVGLVSINQPISPWLASGAIIVSSAWILNRHLTHRLNILFHDQTLTYRADRLILGLLSAIAMTAGYAYSLSSVPFIYSAFALGVPPEKAILPIAFGPAVVLMTVVDSGNFSAIVPWLTVGAWIVFRAATYNPGQDYLALRRSLPR